MTERTTTLDEAFDVDTEEGTTAFAPLPSGRYAAEVEDVSISMTKNGNGQMVGTRWRIVEGAHEGRLVFDNMLIVHTSAEAQRIGRQRFRDMAFACGLTGKVTDLEPLKFRVSYKDTPFVHRYGSSVSGWMLGGSTQARSSRHCRIAAADHAQAIGDHVARARHATDALKAMTEAYRPSPPREPQTASQASQRLDFLNRDPQWRDLIMRGDPAAMEQFHRLNALVANADPIERALTGAAPTAFEVEAPASGAEASLKDQVSFVADARADGVPDENLRAILSSGAPTADDVRWAQSHLTALYQQFLNVPLGSWPPGAVRALHEFARLADATPSKL